jgi:hypothetical protein
VPAAGTFYNPCRRTPRPRFTTRPPHARCIQAASPSPAALRGRFNIGHLATATVACEAPPKHRCRLPAPRLLLPGRFNRRAVSAALSAHGSPQPRRRRTRPYPHIHKDALLAKAVRSQLFRGIATAIHGSGVATAAGRLRTRPASPRRSGIPSRGTLPSLREVVCGGSLRPSRFRPFATLL